MSHLFIPYQLAVMAKEKGFSESCFAEYVQWDGSTPWINIYQDGNPEDTQNYTKECEAPLYQQIVDWLRVQQGTHIGEYLGSDGYTFKIKNTETFRIGLEVNDSDRLKALNRTILECLKFI